MLEAKQRFISAVECAIIELKLFFERASADIVSVVAWKYFSYAVSIAIGIAILVPIYIAYRNWRRAWLSQLVDDAIAQLRRKKGKERLFRLETLLNFRTLFRSSRHYAFRCIDEIIRYAFHTFGAQLRTNYLPSGASVIAILIFLAIVLFVPHPPPHITNLFHPRHLIRFLTSDLRPDVDLSKIFDGLIIVVIALVVFVAESIRGSKTSDEKRVLLKISRLWILALFITLAPLGFLYPPPTGLTAILTIIIAILTILGFAHVLRNLINVDENAESQRNFLKDRVRAIILDSARQRAGNRILFDKIGENKEIRLNLAVSKSWLPEGAANYILIDTSQDGTLADINLYELKALANLLAEQDEQPHQIAAAQEHSDLPDGPAPQAPQARQRKPRKPQASLLRRYREQLPKDSIFVRDRSVLALPIGLAANKRIVEDVRAAVARIFKFSNAQPPSVAFRREMQSTKDRLITAIRGASLGIIDDLRQTYLLVAEEFLITLNELGGGYSAEQARQERSDYFEGWNEVRWLVQDVRDLLIAASDTDNKDIIGTIAYLPFAIAMRALQAGDHLLFQEFLKFASAIYELASAKPVTSNARSFMIERSWRYLKELTDYYVQAPLTEESADG